MAIPYNQIPIGDGILPDKSLSPFFISKRTLDLLMEFGPVAKADDVRFVPMTVANPDAIFRGLRRPNQNDGLCYSVRPEFDPDTPEDQRGDASLPRYGVVFLAFVEVGMMGHVVFDWEWRDEDPDEPGIPLGSQRDFAERVYP